MADPDPSDLRSVVVDHNVLTGSHEGAMPLYVDLTLEAPKDKSCMFRYFFKRPANRHEKLFWFGARGPEMVKEFVRANILFMSMFLAVNCMILARLECELDNLCPLRFVLIFVPQIMNVFMLPRLITSYVLVRCPARCFVRSFVVCGVCISRMGECVRALCAVSACGMVAVVHVPRFVGWLMFILPVVSLCFRWPTSNCCARTRWCRKSTASSALKSPCAPFVCSPPFAPTPRSTMEVSALLQATATSSTPSAVAER